MATQGTPLAGRTELARRCYLLGDVLTLVAYTNVANSLGDTTVAANLVQPPLTNGYAPISMLLARWTISNGIAVYTEPDGPTGFLGDPTWFATGAWGLNPVVGAAIVYGTAVVHFRDNAAPFTALAGKKLRINIQEIVGP